MPRKATPGTKRYKPQPVKRYNVDETGVVETVQEDDTTDEQIEYTVQTAIPTPSDTLNEATEFPKGKQSVAIEHMLAEILASSVRAFTAYLFTPPNAMTEQEATSTAFPPVRMLQRRIDKWLKIKLPFHKMDAKDKADIEEMLTAVTNYAIRLLAKTYKKIVDNIMHKQPKPVVNNAPLNGHEQRVYQQMQQQRSMREQQELEKSAKQAYNDLSYQDKQQMLSLIGSDIGLEG